MVCVFSPCFFGICTSTYHVFIFEMYLWFASHMNNNFFFNNLLGHFGVSAY